MHAGVHARSRRRAAFPLQEPRPPRAAAADARPAPPPAQSPPPVALARPLPSLCSAGRLWVLRAVICTRAPRVGASARAERPAPGARGAPSQRPSDNERRRGGRGEQVSGLRAAAALGVGAVVRRRRGRAGVGGGRAQRAASGEAVLPSAGEPLPLFRRGRHSRLGIPAPVAQTKRPTAAAPASFAGRGAGGGVAPSHARLPRHSPSRGPGPQHLRRAGGAGVARRCPRGRRPRAKGEAPRARAGGGA